MIVKVNKVFEGIEQIIEKSGYVGEDKNSYCLLFGIEYVRS